MAAVLSARIGMLVRVFVLEMCPSHDSADRARAVDPRRLSARSAAVPTGRLIAGIGALAAIAFPAGAPARAPERLNPTPRETPALARAKAEADRGLPAPSPRPAAAPGTQLFTGPTEFDGMRALDNEQWALYTPPDPTGSIGPSNYLEIVNSMIAAYDPTLGSPQSMDGHLGPVDLQTFFIDSGPATFQAASPTDPKNHPGDSIFDVQVQWDAASNRWLIASADLEEPPNNTTPGDGALVYGWSKSDDPTGPWCIYRTPAGQHFEDYPKLGHDDTHLMIGSNEFVDSSESSGFVGAKLWTVPTPDAAPIAGPCPATAVNGPQAVSGGFTPVPVNIADPAGAATSGYVVATTAAGTQSSLRLYTVDSSGDISGTSTQIPVSTWSAPPNVQQPGTTDLIDSQDGRLTQAVAVRDTDTGNETIWTQHTVRSADGQRAEVRWYQLDAVAKTKLQEGSVADPSNSVFNAAISPAADGSTAALQYNAGGRFHLVEVRAQTRDSSTPLGTMVNELRIGGASEDVDTDFSCALEGGPCRWGDYAGASPDPTHPDVVWGTNQLNGPLQPDNDASWITRNFALQFGGPDPAPDTTVDGFPFSSAAPAPTFNFASSETGSTFRCSIDSGAFGACTPGHAFGPSLGNGTHTFAADAIDAAGQADPSPAQGSFTIAAPLPDTLIDSAPPASGNSRSAAFTFHSTKAGSSFQCSLDGSPFAGCAAPFTAAHLSPATHAFAVRAVDAQGNLDPTPATSSFKVELAPATASVASQHASRSGSVAVRVRCPASREQSCTGTVTLTLASTTTARALKLASGGFRVRWGGSATVHVKLTRRGRTLLQRKRRLRVKAGMRFDSPARSSSRTFTLSAPRRS
jgi:hypothetical protein